MAQSRLASQIGRVVDDRYRLTTPLGAGASAEVYLATDVRLDRQVAVKILKPALASDSQFLERFRTEARTVAGISHPNVVVVHDWGEGEVPYLVTEYLAGGSLRAMLTTGSRLSPSQALVVGLDVCRGLAHAHGMGLVHRDLKPANLLFDPEGRLRIADFGLARAIAEASVTEELGTMVGTARYAAPEQARGMRVDGKADVYSLAALLVEAVTGQVPFAADTAVATLMARTETDLPVPGALGPLRAAIERAGRLDPEERPDAEEFGLALLAASERLPAPRPLPLVGALTEAETTSAPGELTQTMRAPAPGDPAIADAAAGLANGHGSPTMAPPGESPGSTPPGGPLTVPITPAPVPVPGAGGEEPPEGKKRRRWRYVFAAVALIAMGAGGYFAFQTLRTPTYTVPDVAGEQLADIQLIADQNGWLIDDKDARENGTAPGEIISTDPAAGESLEEGGTLVVLVSLGNELTDVPTGVEGKELEGVQKAFEDAGLAVRATPQFHEEIPAGSVIGFAEEPPERLPQGTEVELLVSDGPAPRTVPQVGNGMTFDQYAAKLADVQLKPKRIDEFSETVPKGVVISLGTDPGTEVPRGSEIEVVVSKGPERVKVPDVIGMRVKPAEKTLKDAGLKIGTKNRGAGIVMATNPKPGQQVKPGTEVDLFVAKA